MNSRLLHGVVDFVRRRRREAFVLIAIVTLDHLGWLPRLQVDQWQTNVSATGSGFQHVALAGVLVFGWALIDMLVTHEVTER